MYNTSNLGNKRQFIIFLANVKELIISLVNLLIYLVFFTILKNQCMLKEHIFHCTSNEK